MSRSAADLPEDPAELRRFAAALATEVHAKTLLIEKLRMQLSILRRARFGRSSEKLDRETVVQAPMPTLPIEKGRPGPALLAHVLVSKYCDHLPLYRQADIYGRSGVEIDRSVMAGWVGHMAALLEPLAERIARHVRAGAALHADDTRFPFSILAVAERKPADYGRR
jgi:transposase